MRFKAGDCVKVVGRDRTSADAKDGLFYPYFSGLAGTVDRIYEKEVCVKVDFETLPEDVLRRHLETQESIRKKWLNGLSDEARNRLTAEDKKFELAYTILVHSTDLERVSKGEAKPVAVKSVRPLSAGETPAREPKLKRAPRSRVKAASKAEASAEVASAARAAPKVKPAAKPAAAGKLKTEAKAVVAKTAGAGISARASERAAKAAKPAPKVETKPAKAAAPKATAQKAGGAKTKSTKTLTKADLEAAEREFLKERAKALKGKE